MGSASSLAPGILLTISALAGCTASGPSYDASAGSIPVPADTARMVFFRTSESPLYSARRARIHIDDTPSGHCALDGFLVRDVAPGRHRLAVDLWDAPGECVILLEADAGEIYYFQVDSRPASYWSFATPSALADLLGGSVAVSAATGLAGLEAESYGKQCGGAFRLYPVDPARARKTLGGLRESD